MTPFCLAVRNLRYYWRTNIVVIVGLALAVAVITGSMIVGDSVTGSLRDTALARLGRIDYALIAPHFFRAKLADELARDPSLKGARIAPLIVIRGSVESATDETVIPAVGVNGVDDSFWRFFPGKSHLISGRQAAVNTALARQLKVKPGDSILVNIDKQGAVPSGTFFAHRSTQDTLRSLRLDVVAVLDDKSGGAFRLDFAADTRPAVFVSREWLASEISKQDLANAIVVEAPSATERELRDALASKCALADQGLKVVTNRQQGYISFESTGMLLDDRQLKVAQEAASKLDARQSITSIYLATHIRRANDRTKDIAYCVTAATEPLAPFKFSSGGGSSPGDDGIWLNTWAAEALGARPGEELEVAYLSPKSDGIYRDVSIRLKLKGIVDMVGPAVDRYLVPAFEGITDADSIDEWNAPFPVDLTQVTEQDEAYWTRYKTTPKAFVSLNTAKSMWQSNQPEAQWVTSLRIAPGPKTDLETLARKFEQAVTRNLSPETSSMVFRPVRQIALASAKGSTDFGQLFMAMGFFLVLAGAGMAGMFMRLSTERRAAETGVMLACGFKPALAMRVLLGEGLLLTAIGTALGVPLGVLYGWGIIAGLTSWWVGAVGNSPLWLHVSAGSLAASSAAGLVVGLASLGSAALKLRRTDALKLLAGWQSMRVIAVPKTVLRVKLTLVVSLAAAILLMLVPMGSKQAAFFGSGAALLIAGLSGLNLLLIHMMKAKMSSPTLSGLAIRSAAANRGRSLMILGLLACAGFIVITAAANTRDFSRTDYTRRDSGSGGFALRAMSSLPIHYDLASPAGRANLGFSPEDEAAMRGAKIFPFLMSSGDDVSCLNISKPASPVMLGVTRQMTKRGGFSVETAGNIGNPWTLLWKNSRSAAPAFGDSNSVIWNLHSGLGKDYTVPDGSGNPVQLRFDGLLAGSIFAGELLVSEDRFKREFPNVTEPRYFLIETPKGKEDAVASALRRNLGKMGMEITRTGDLLNAFARVQNTYLSVFLALGGLGIVLGAFGTAAALLRGALERRNELALMLAQGFTVSDISKLLLLENAGLLIGGLAVGAISALVAIAPAMTSIDTKTNWMAIAIVLTGTLAVGLFSCIIAVRKTVNGSLVQVLRGE